MKSIRPARADAFSSSNLPLAGKKSGKVRDWYSLGGGRRLIVTTDRLSAFDIELGALPYKGQVLNQLSAFWFESTKDIIPNHLIETPDPNVSIVHEVDPIPIEVIVRGYITGVTHTALWYRYSLGEREIYGWHFPDGLKKNEKLPEPIITPTTKGGPTGHDERLSCAEVVSKGRLDAPSWEQIQSAALALFKRGTEVAARAGLILVDTKYEFGRRADGSIMLIDEVHTPDSSRFWKASSYKDRIAAGQEPENFDKEFIRLKYAGLGYQGEGPAPELPDSVWDEASALYRSACEKLTGRVFEPGEYPPEPRIEANLRKAGYIK